jgi:transcriptional regulator with XRE-family HTH domain
MYSYLGATDDVPEKVEIPATLPQVYPGAVKETGMKQQDKKTSNLIHNSIKLLDYALKFDSHIFEADPTNKKIFDLISFQLHVMQIVIRRKEAHVYQYIQKDASAEKLLDLQKSMTYYYEFVISQWSQETFNALKGMLDESKAFRILEVAFYASTAMTYESVAEWWIDTFETVFWGHVGRLAFGRLLVAPGTFSKADKDIFDFQGHEPFHEAWKVFGVGGKQTKEIEERVFQYFKKIKYPKNIPLPDFLSNHAYDSYDDAENYMEEVFKAIRAKDSKEAVKDLVDGKLRHNISTRANSRLKNLLIQYRSQKSGGRSPKDIGEIIRDLRIKKNISIEELADKTNSPVELIKRIEAGKKHNLFISEFLPIARILEADIGDILNKDDKNRTIQVVNTDAYSPEEEVIYQDLREYGLSLFDENSTDYKILEYLLYKNPDPEPQDLADHVNRTKSTVYKARKKIRSKIKTIKNN